ncbi:MAG: response regulator, partial [Gemmatimonadota bacterium]|nr:response regulator [Gemmatimonadota bacterium]
MIDDLEEVRDQHRVILRHAGITETAEAADGRQAIELLTDPANQFDLILCDLQMPRLDGVETIRALSYMGVQGAVAVLSVEEEQVMAGAGFLAEAHGLHYIGSLAKPLTREKLDEILQRMREPAAAEPAGGVPCHPTAADVARGLDDDEFALFYQPQLHMQ